MTVATRKFNPGFLSEDELVASFCVRTHEFESIVETLRDCTGNSNQHQIVIGPRGSGKTTLLLRVAAEIGRDAELSRDLLPVRFAEESYSVSTIGEFWLECLARLAEGTPHDEPGPDLNRTFDELRTILDDQVLADRSLGSLLDYSDRQRKRLVLLVENLNKIFEDLVDPNAGWRLRHTLQTEPRVILIGSATSRFKEIDKPDHALYEILRDHCLEPLNTRECLALWESLSGEPATEERVRPLEILTGGSPRLLAIVARFAAGRSIGDLMDRLLDLIDEHTEYFKSHIDSLPPQERRVYLALAELWKPATTREIGERSRVPTNKCSAHLKRLVARGTVREAGGTPRRKQFYLSERLYNIYYLLRRHRGPEKVVRALLDFMVSYYSPLALAAMALDLTCDAIRQEASECHQNPLREALLEELPVLVDLAQSRDYAADDHHLLKATTYLSRVLYLARQQRLEDALALSDDLVLYFRSSSPHPNREDPAVAGSLALAAVLLNALERHEEAIATCDDALGALGADLPEEPLSITGMALYSKADSLRKLGHLEDALDAYDLFSRTVGPAIDGASRPFAARAHYNRIRILDDLGRSQNALNECESMASLFGGDDNPEVQGLMASALLLKGHILFHQGRSEEALVAVDQAITRHDKGSGKVRDLDVLLYFVRGALLTALERRREARSAFREVLRRLVDAEWEEADELRASARLELAALALERGDRDTANARADQVLSQTEGAADGDRCRAFLIRAQATLLGNPADSLADYGAALEILPHLEMRPPETVSSLLVAAATLGAGPVLELVAGSPSDQILLPVRTALELELGGAPRVAKEVEEVAIDIRRDLAALRREDTPDAEH